MNKLNNTNSKVENEEHSSILESLKQACQQAKLIKQGKLYKKTWNDFKKELKK